MKVPSPFRPAAVLAAFALLALNAPRAAAQNAPQDSRWNAFVGCWSPVGAPSDATVSMLCIVPTAGASSVELATVTNGAVSARENVVATGEAVTTSRDGCKGWQRANWSRDDERIYLHAEYNCPGGRHQVSTSLLGLTSDGQLMDVQGLSAGSNTGVRVAVYQEIQMPDSLPADIAEALGTRTMATDAARVAASAPVTNAAIIEASSNVDPLVVEAWLANHGNVQAVSGKDLVALANAGVPGDVTDVLVALANPQRFQLNSALRGEPSQYASNSSLNGVADERQDQPRAAARTGPCAYSVYWMGGETCYYSPWYGYGAVNPAWGYGGYYGYGSVWGASPYYYSPFAGYGYGAGWYGGGSVVVVQQPNSGVQNHGRVVNGRGYVSGRSSPSGSGPATSNSRGGEASGSSNSGSSNSSSSSGRTAHRRGGGGGGL